MAFINFGNRVVDKCTLNKEDQRRAEERRQLNRFREKRQFFPCTYHPLEHAHETSSDAMRCDDYVRQQKQKAGQFEREREVTKIQHERERELKKIQNERERELKKMQYEREREMKKMQYEREREMKKMDYDHEKYMMDKKLEALDKFKAMGISGRQLPMLCGKQNAAIEYYTDSDSS